MDKLAIITVVYNNYDVLKDFSKSLQKQENKNFELFISDLSDDKKNIDSKGVKINIFQDKNKGFAYGVNIALRAAIDKNYKYFCVINNDTSFKEDFISKCLSSIKKNPFSIIGGKIYYSGGYEYHKRRYKKINKGNMIWYAGGYIDWNHALSFHLGIDKVDIGQYDKFKITNFITGALMLFDKSVIDKIGFLDETYFLYFEDADYCVRAKNKKIPLFYDPTLMLWHKVSQSTGGSGSNIHMRYQTRNQLKFGLRYAPLKTKMHLIKNYLHRFLKEQS
ncbi:MAG: glycosyltransferase family 2 protein [bacterium]